MWVCSCACGTAEIERNGKELRSGHCVSCGCVRADPTLWGKFKFRIDVPTQQPVPARLPSTRGKVMLDGALVRLSALCEARGLNYDTVRNRLKRGADVAKAIAPSPSRNPLVGKRFARLTIVDVHIVKNERSAICSCDCGAVKKVRVEHLRTGRVTSCGCAHLETVSQGRAPSIVDVFGEQMSIGELAALVGVKPIALWARMRRGATAEEAAFGKGAQQ